MKYAVVQICCDRQDGICYFEDYESAADYRAEYEGDHSMMPDSYRHLRVGVLLQIDRYEQQPPHVGLEDHQVWVWMGSRAALGMDVPHWEVRGTGALD